GRPLIVARGRSGTVLADAKSGLPVMLEDDVLIEAASRMLPWGPMVGSRRLTEGTLYWYSHHVKRPLPIIEVSFADPSGTRLYIDPATGQIAGVGDRSARTYRWLFNFVHDYDLPVLLRNQPARDVVVWLLSVAGLVVSISGAVVGWRVL